jgi:hypothetical protein
MSTEDYNNIKKLKSYKKHNRSIGRGNGEHWDLPKFTLSREKNLETLYRLFEEFLDERFFLFRCVDVQGKSMIAKKLFSNFLLNYLAKEVGDGPGYDFNSDPENLRRKLAHQFLDDWAIISEDQLAEKIRVPLRNEIRLYAKFCFDHDMGSKNLMLLNAILQDEDEDNGLDPIYLRSGRGIIRFNGTYDTKK